MTLESALMTLVTPPVLYLTLAWIIVWKGFGLWHSAKNSQKPWFIALLVINSLGILPIIYLFAFRKNRKKLTILGKKR
jgi:hypothetical protein|tara:strand:+ start:1235 stop:1468 length:234 start_codon:yes stop_codon:yes gene_type:complete